MLDITSFRRICNSLEICSRHQFFLSQALMDLTPHLHPQIDLFGHFQTVSPAIIDLCPAWVDGTIHTAHLRSREVITYFEVIRCPKPHLSLFRAKSTWLDVQLFIQTHLSSMFNM